MITDSLTTHCSWSVDDFLKLQDWDSVSALNVLKDALSNLQFIAEDYWRISGCLDLVKVNLNQGEAIGLRDESRCKWLNN